MCRYGPESGGADRGSDRLCLVQRFTAQPSIADAPIRFKTKLSGEMHGQPPSNEEA
ncbi:hypothetical protein Tcan_05811 [Toxocara canis]|uniref:Uncharacterized protein n=1 Tax=Toxocara canis TaxID=6265 RepID=A0A0B2URI0_TOXCA|nr:hypothetical protein Tcan_05811 [Toxocara canis]